jgi:hypothetical protein
MNIEQIKQAIEEFGDRAFERFTMRVAPHVSEQCDLDSNKDFDNYDLHDMQLKPLHDLFKNDSSVYGYDAYLMWEWQNKPSDNIQTPWRKFNFNLDCECEINNLNWEFCGTNVRRKTSAELPFDLERAISGDDIEYNKLSGQWAVCKFIADCGDNGIKIQFKNQYHWCQYVYLRMKYPPKVNK